MIKYARNNGKTGSLPKQKEIWREILMCIILRLPPGNGDYARLPSLTAHRERKDLLFRDSQKNEEEL